MINDASGTRWAKASAAAMLWALGTGSGCASEVGSAEEDVPLASQELEGRKPSPPTFKVLGPQGKPLGKSYEQWSAEWWRWSYGSPGSTHPVLDQTGEYCGVNQAQKVFFLAGTFGETVTRSCTIPHGKPIFVPVLNLAYDNCGVPPEYQVPICDIIDLEEHFADHVTDIELIVDGKVLGSSKEELAAYLVDVTRFSYTVPAEDSIYDVFGIEFEGRCSPSFSTGYYVMLALSPGHHDVQFAGTQDDGFGIDVTYSLEQE